MMTWSKHWWMALALWGAMGASAEAQRNRVRPNDPSTCPYTEGDPEVMAAAGIVSLGGFEFGNSDTAQVDEFLATADIRWIETEHFEIGIGLPTYRIPQREKNKIRTELTWLQEVLPEVNPKTRQLDPWLRAHLYAQRAERAYARFLEIVQLEQDVFPEPDTTWLLGTPYWGEGPHLGQNGKFEILILPSEALHVSYLRQEFGLSIRKTQRWNVVERDTLTVAIHDDDGSLTRDTAMHGHVVFNLAHNFLDGLKHYSYDTPIWVHEGLAHFLEREVSPRYNSFDSSEGGIAEETRKSKWHKETRSLVRGGDAPRMASMMSLRNYAELELDHHFATWSMVRFLVEQHPEQFALFLQSIKGWKNDEGIADGSNMPQKHRDSFREHFGWNYAQFDTAWQEWVMATEEEPPDDAFPLPGSDD